MKFAAIGDLHIHNNGDESSQILMRFFDHIDDSFDAIFLLGDLFDIFVGDFEEYYHKYQAIFDKIKEIANKGTEVHFFEGNHDFHVDKFISRLFKSDKNIFYHFENYEFYSNEKKYLITHGDLIDETDTLYLLYISFMKSKFMKFVINKLLNFKLVQLIGNKLSSDSKARKKKRHFDIDFQKKRIRDLMSNFAKERKVDVIICGHYHVDDYYKGDNITYANPGFSGIDAKYLYCDQDYMEIKSLKVSSL